MATETHEDVRAKVLEAKERLGKALEALWDEVDTHADRSGSVFSNLTIAEMALAEAKSAYVAMVVSR